MDNSIAMPSTSKLFCHVCFGIMTKVKQVTSAATSCDFLNKSTKEKKLFSFHYFSSTSDIYIWIHLHRKLSICFNVNVVLIPAAEALLSKILPSGILLFLKPNWLKQIFHMLFFFFSFLKLTKLDYLGSGAKEFSFTR